MNETLSVVHLDRLQLAFAPKPWAFATERRAEIDVWFAALRREKPALWNGRVLLLHDHAVADRVFSGHFLETDFASFPPGALGAGRRRRSTIVLVRRRYLPQTARSCSG